MDFVRVSILTFGCTVYNLSTYEYVIILILQSFLFLPFLIPPLFLLLSCLCAPLSSSLPFSPFSSSHVLPIPYPILSVPSPQYVFPFLLLSCSSHSLPYPFCALPTICLSLSPPLFSVFSHFLSVFSSPYYLIISFFILSMYYSCCPCTLLENLTDDAMD